MSLNANDAGVVSMSFGIKKGVLVIAFPRPTTWIGLPAAEVEDLIAVLQEWRAEMEKWA